MRPLLGLALAVPLVAAAARPSHAGSVLVFGDHAARDAVAEILARDGHDVTVAPTVPDDLAPYQVVWQASATEGMDNAARERLVEHVRSGGGLLLAGEVGEAAQYVCRSDEVVLNTLLATGYVELCEAGPAERVLEFVPTAHGGVTQVPDPLSTWAPSGVAGLVGVEEPYVMARGKDGTVAAAAWSSNELVGGAGQVVVMMDADWPAVDRGADAIARDVARFLFEGPAEVPDEADPTLGTSGDGATTPPRPPAPGEVDLAGGTAGGEPAGGDDDPIEDDGVYEGAEAEDELEVGGCVAGGGRTSGLLGVLALALLIARRRA